MNVKILSGTIADGKKYAAGDVADVGKDTADQLIRAGKAESYTPPPKPKTTKTKKRNASRVTRHED